MSPRTSVVHDDSSRDTGDRRGPPQSGTARRLSLIAASALLDVISIAVRRIPLRLRYLPADAMTLPIPRLVPGLRSTTTRNFAIMLGAAGDDPLAALLASESICNYGRMAIDFLAARTETAEQLRARATVIGVEHFSAAQRDGRGVILTVPHLGSWDVGAVIAEAYGVKLTVVTESNWVTELVAGARVDHGVTLVPRNRSLRPLIRALARGEAVVLLSDIANDGVQTIDVPFFGHPTPFPIGAARLAARTGAPVVVVYAVRLSNNSYRVEALPALRVNPCLAEEDAVCELTAAIAAMFQRIVTAYPAQWYPFHPIWPDLFDAATSLGENGHVQPACRPAAEAKETR